MARVKFGGKEITADPVEQTKAGDYLMRARLHTARTSAGTLILVKQSEIIEMAAAETPGNAPMPADLEDKAGSLGALEAAMAAELKTLPSPSELIAKHQQNIAEGKTPPGRPIQPRVTAGPPQVGPDQ